MKAAGVRGTFKVPDHPPVFPVLFRENGSHDIQRDREFSHKVFLMDS